MVLDNCSYNKVKLIHELSRIAWFLEKHAIKDAQDAGDLQCKESLVALHRDLLKHIEKLQKNMCIISQ